MKMNTEKFQNSKENEIVEEEAACTHFISFCDEVYPENELLMDPLGEIPEQFDEDYFYENYRDEIMFHDKGLQPDQ